MVAKSPCELSQAPVIFFLEFCTSGSPVSSVPDGLALLCPPHPWEGGRVSAASRSGIVVNGRSHTVHMGQAAACEAQGQALVGTRAKPRGLSISSGKWGGSSSVSGVL